MNLKRALCNACLPTAFLLLFAATCLPANANFSGSDHFSAPSADWGLDSAGGAGHFDLRNGKLNFVTVAAPTINDTVQRAWIANVGDYSADWSVRVDVSIGNFPMTTEQFASLDILVENFNDVSNDFVRMVLRRDDMDARSFYADSVSNGQFTPAPVFVPTLATDATLGLSYDSATRMITAAYDADGSANGFLFHPILTVPIESGASDWNMNPTDSFQVWLVGQTQFLDVSLGQAALDNFVASGEQLLVVPEPSIVALATGLLSWPLCFARSYRHKTDNT